MLPNLTYFASTTENACTYEDIQMHERLILKYLQWDINLPNFSTWINTVTLQWDSFGEIIHTLSDKIPIDPTFLSNFKFRAQNKISLNLFQTLTQLIDIIIYDIEYLQFHEKFLTISIVFLLFFKFYNRINFSEIAFLEISHIDKNQDVIFVFNLFLNKYYNIDYLNIFDHIQYVSCYMDSIIYSENTKMGGNNVIKIFNF
jgi:hypothetical protein